jgi:hypothetical protein
MSKTIRCRSTEILTATQWNGPGDHAEVETNDNRYYFTRLGICCGQACGVERGDWIIEDGDVVVDVVTDEEFRRDYEAVEGEG